MVAWWIAAITFVAGANLGLFTFALLRASSGEDAYERGYAAGRGRAEGRDL